MHNAFAHEALQGMCHVWQKKDNCVETCPWISNLSTVATSHKHIFGSLIHVTGFLSQRPQRQPAPFFCLNKASQHVNIQHLYCSTKALSVFIMVLHSNFTPCTSSKQHCKIRRINHQAPKACECILFCLHACCAKGYV